jgi:hypothetical protein
MNWKIRRTSIVNILCTFSDFVSTYTNFERMSHIKACVINNWSYKGFSENIYHFLWIYCKLKYYIKCAATISINIAICELFSYNFCKDTVFQKKKKKKNSNLNDLSRLV